MMLYLIITNNINKYNMIPFVDLNAQYRSIKSEIDNAIKECIDETNFIKGKAVTDFERSFC